MPAQVPFLILLFLAVESQFVCVLNSLSVLIWRIFSMRKNVVYINMSTVHQGQAQVQVELIIINSWRQNKKTSAKTRKVVIRGNVIATVLRAWEKNSCLTFVTCYL